VCKHPFSHERSDSDSVIDANPEVEALLLSAIAEKGRITFAEYMDICLYSDSGYYNSGYAEISGVGSQSSDFMTSPEAHPVFGAVLASKIHDMWQGLDQPDNFSIVEMGAGNGTLARDILREISFSYREMSSTVKYSIVEQSAPLMERQELALQNLPVRWHHGSAVSLPLSSVTGVLLSNELPDTFPAHRMVRRDGLVKEIYTILDANGNFADIEDTPSVDIDGGTSAPDGIEFTYSPDLEPWIRGMAAALNRGNIITIDYGITSPESQAPRVYSRSMGEHNGRQATQSKYQMPGVADITASVDFARLVRLGEQAGLRTELLTSQAEFLRQNNYQAHLERIIARTAVRGLTASTHYFAAFPLVSEDYLGGFQVLVQSKNVD